MNPLVAFFRLIRCFNLVIIALILFLIKYCLVDPLSLVVAIPECLDGFQWILLGVASVALAASGNVINDIMDQDIDLVNKPDKVIVGKAIPETLAWNIYYAFSALGIGAGVWLSEALSSQYHGAIFIMVSAALWFYSTSYKRKLLIGNLIVAGLGALVVMMPNFMEYRCNTGNPMVAEAMQHGAKMMFPAQGFIMAFAAFSFITTLIREVIKDMEDMKGDDSEGATTLPITVGFSATKWIVILCSILLMVGVFFLMNVRLGVGDDLTFYYLALAVQLPSLALIGLLFTAKEPSDMAPASMLIKAIMLTGILSMLVLRYSFVHA